MGYILFEIINEVNRVVITSNDDKGVRREEDWTIPFDVTLEGDWGNERIGTVKYVVWMLHLMGMQWNGQKRCVTWLLI
jgi:hypothetical protein